MAEGKKSFIAYCEWYDLIDDLEDDEAGKVCKWLFRYVNDLQPNFPVEKHLKVICKVMKTQLKADLVKWEDERIKRSEAGKKGMAIRWNNKDNNVITSNNKNNTDINDITNITDNVNVNVNVDDNVNVLKEKNNIKKEIYDIKTLTEFLEELQELFGVLAPKYNDLAVKMYNDLGYQNAIYEIKSNMDQPNPINATYLKLYNNKAESSGSEWLDKMKKGL